MKKRKIKILIIEKSGIIQRGLSVLLADKNNIPLNIEHCEGNCDMEHSFLKATPQIMIASPSVFKKNEKQIKILKEKYDLLTIGLIYTYQHPDSLRDFDALIYLNDKPEDIQSTISRLLNTQASSNNSSPSDSLTKREKEILKLLVSGYTTRKIADALFISTHTVNAHRKNIMRKLDIKTVSGLTIYAVLNNIISLKEA